MIISATIMSCTDESLDPRPDLNENVGAVTKITTDATFFDLLLPMANQTVTLTIDVDGFDLTEISSVDILLTYVDQNGTDDPFQGLIPKVYSNIMLSNVTSFPSGDITFTGQQLADAIEGVEVDTFDLGDTFSLTFPIHTVDGRTLTVALSSDLCNEPAQPSFGGCEVGWAVACPSDLATAVDYTIIATSGGLAALNGQTGSMTWESEGAGSYSWDSFTFGAYQLLYACCEQDRGESILRISDICNVLSISSADGFGCGWSLSNVTIAGPTLTVDVFGACMGTLVLEMVRSDGSDWPPLS